MKAIVHSTGANTFFGKAADLVNKSEKRSHIHVVLKSIACFCIVFIFVGVVTELITQFAIRGKPCSGASPKQNAKAFIDELTLSFPPQNRIL
jgi:magnesium-transporting ATPase (P-type)